MKLVLISRVIAKLNKRYKRNVVSNEKQRAVFEVLLLRATNGNLMGHETGEVLEELTIPIRTVQRVWEKGKIFGSGSYGRY